MLTAEQRNFVESQRILRLATASAKGAPHVVPVCFALDADTVYIALDEKPKRVPPLALKRVRNILENPQVALVADRYDDADWWFLGFVMLRGRAEVLGGGTEHAHAIALLRERYAQYRRMALEQRPIIAVRVTHTTGWGNL